MKKFVFILNPQAGRGRSLQIWNEVKQHLESLANTHSFHYETHTLGQHFDEAMFLKDCIVVAIGGDGTVHHVGQLAADRGIPLGIIPAGTGNDYAQTLGIPMDARHAVENLFHGLPSRLDVLRVNGEVVLNACGFGIDADVVRYIESRPIWKRLGSLGYAIAVPRALMRFKPFTVHLELTAHQDEAAASETRTWTERKVALLVVANGHRFGGGMNVAPDADPRDGIFNICIASNLSRFNLLRLFPTIYSGKHTAHRNVTMLQGQQLTATFQTEPRPGEYDGEMSNEQSRVVIHIEPGRLSVITPA